MALNAMYSYSLLEFQTFAFYLEKEHTKQSFCVLQFLLKPFYMLRMKQGWSINLLLWAINFFLVQKQQ